MVTIAKWYNLNTPQKACLMGNGATYSVPITLRVTFVWLHYNLTQAQKTEVMCTPQATGDPPQSSNPKHHYKQS